MSHQPLAVCLELPGDLGGGPCGWKSPALSGIEMRG
jgi:hypothetical protein